MYAQFITDLCQFMLASRIADASDLRGCTRAEIAALENRLGGRLPAAFTEALLAMGKACGDLMDGDDFSIAGIDSAIEVAQDITTEEDAPWKLSPSMFPFMQHHGYVFHFIDLDAADDDPPVWAYVETEPGPTQLKPSFTSWLRELAIWEVERTPWNDEVCREIDLHRDAWMERKTILDQYDVQAHQFRKALLQRVAAADQARGKITTALEFQELWNREFRTTDLCTTLLKEGKRIPWGWVHASEV